MDIERISKQIGFIAEIDKLKKIIRQTSLADASRQENVAEHSWHIAVSALILSEYANEELQVNRVIKMLLIHDLVEIYAGDTFLYDDVDKAEKYNLERDAAQKIFSLLPEDQGDFYLELWLEFEEMKTPEAKFAKAVDHLQPLLLAFQNEGWSWKKHDLQKEQVLERKEPMRYGSEKLWEYAKAMLDEAEENGYFPER